MVFYVENKKYADMMVPKAWCTKECLGICCGWRGGVISGKYKQCDLQERWRMRRETRFALICEGA